MTGAPAVAAAAAFPLSAGLSRRHRRLQQARRIRLRRPCQRLPRARCPARGAGWVAGLGRRRAGELHHLLGSDQFLVLGDSTPPSPPPGYDPLPLQADRDPAAPQPRHRSPSPRRSRCIAPSTARPRPWPPGLQPSSHRTRSPAQHSAEKPVQFRFAIGGQQFGAELEALPFVKGPSRICRITSHRD